MHLQIKSNPNVVKIKCTSNIAKVKRINVFDGFNSFNTTAFNDDQLLS